MKTASNPVTTNPTASLRRGIHKEDTMKIYRVTDDYNGKERWFETKGRANAHAELWAGVLDIEAFESGRKDFDGVKWVTVHEISSKSELISMLNIWRRG